MTAVFQTSFNLVFKNFNLNGYEILKFLVHFLLTSIQERMSSSEEIDCEFDAVNSGSTETERVDISSIKIGSYMIINNHTCKVVDYKKVKDGKHGHAKAVIKALDILTGRQVETNRPAHAMVEVPKVSREVYSVANINDGFLVLQNSQGDVREDVELPENKLGEDISSSFKSKEVVNGDLVLFVTIMKIGTYLNVIDYRLKE